MIYFIKRMEKCEALLRLLKVLIISYRNIIIAYFKLLQVLLGIVAQIHVNVGRDKGKLVFAE